MTQPPGPHWPPLQPEYQLPPQPPAKKKATSDSSYFPIVLSVVLGLIGLLVFGSCVAYLASPEKESTLSTRPAAMPAPTVTSTETFEATTEPAPTIEALEPEPTLTRAQTEAIEAAESYLDFGSFSKRGLIEQLTSKYGEGFAKKDALFAVDYINANWKAEAVEAAESYLDFGSFSRSELMQQLESPYGENFTHDQAAYAVNKVY